MLCDLYVNSEVNFDTVFHAQLVVSSSHRASCLRFVSAMAAAGNDPPRWDAKLAGGADPDGSGSANNRHQLRRSALQNGVSKDRAQIFFAAPLGFPLLTNGS